MLLRTPARDPSGYPQRMLPTVIAAIVFALLMAIALLVD